MSEEYRLSSLLATSNYITVSKILIEKIGLVEAVVFGELCSESDYWHQRNEITEDGYFFSTVENIEDKLHIQRKVQERVIRNLIKAELISVSRRGLPARRYVKINEENLANLLGQLGLTSSSETAQLDGTKCTSNNNIINKNINNNIFVPPTVEQVKSYCEERKNKIDAAAFVDFYQSKGWLIGKNKMKDWKAAVRTWERHNNSTSSNEPKRMSSLEYFGKELWEMTAEEQEEYYKLYG